MNELLPQKLGRILRLDRHLKVQRLPWVATIFVHFLLGLGMLALLMIWRSQRPADTRFLPVIVLFGGYWLVFSVFTAVQTRWLRSFELQLLPGAVQFTNWGRTILLVEPEVINGRVANVICLRAGEAKAKIPLYALPELRDRAAVVEH